MQPVLILQHMSADDPAYLGQWLRARGLTFEVVDSEAGRPIPRSLAGYAALAILGGEMSANDPLEPLRQAERLVLEALREGVPTLGHCLGGQLMARALGARVGPSPAPEIGWQPMQVRDTAAARHWFGGAGETTVFQWHYEAFELPPGAEPLAGSAACAHQAFAIGPHLAMQFHVEIDAAKLRQWSADPGEGYRKALARYPGTVQDVPAMHAGIASHLVRQRTLADRIYAHWIDAARRG